MMTPIIAALVLIIAIVMFITIANIFMGIFSGDNYKIAVYKHGISHPLTIWRISRYLKKIPNGGNCNAKNIMRKLNNTFFTNIISPKIKRYRMKIITLNIKSFLQYTKNKSPEYFLNGRNNIFTENWCIPSRYLLYIDYTDKNFTIGDAIEKSMAMYSKELDNTILYYEINDGYYFDLDYNRKLVILQNSSTYRDYENLPHFNVDSIVKLIVASDNSIEFLILFNKIRELYDNYIDNRFSDSNINRTISINDFICDEVIKAYNNYDGKAPLEWHLELTLGNEIEDGLELIY